MLILAVVGCRVKAEAEAEVGVAVEAEDVEDVEEGRIAYTRCWNKVLKMFPVMVSVADAQRTLIRDGKVDMEPERLVRYAWTCRPCRTTSADASSQRREVRPVPSAVRGPSRAAR